MSGNYKLRKEQKIVRLWSYTSIFIWNVECSWRKQNLITKHWILHGGLCFFTTSSKSPAFKIHLCTIHSHLSFWWFFVRDEGKEFWCLNRNELMPVDQRFLQISWHYKSEFIHPKPMYKMCSPSQFSSQESRNLKWMG